MYASRKPQIEELLKQMEALRIELDRPPTMDEILAHERAPKGETDEIMRDLECMSSEHFGQLAWQFKRMSGSSGLKVQAAIAC